MIDTRELRSGNFLMLKLGSIVEVEDIFNDYGINSVHGEPEYWKQDLFYIPLTEEVAERCGFKQQDKLGKGLWLILDHFIWFQFIDGEVKMWVGKEKALVCKYLHDLQNLVFWHTRIELEVKS